MARKDYYHDPDAPRPNSIRPAAAVALFNAEDKLLILRRQDNDKWTLPGGTLEFGESLIECAVREVKEETGLDIEVMSLVGTYTDPQVVVAYTDGEVRQEFSFVYLGVIKGGAVSIDKESTAFEWMPLEDTLNLPLAESQKRRLEDLREFRISGKIMLR